jgi:hypothetical protein
LSIIDFTVETDLSLVILDYETLFEFLFWTNFKFANYLSDFLEFILLRVLIWGVTKCGLCVNTFFGLLRSARQQFLDKFYTNCMYD